MIYYNFNLDKLKLYMIEPENDIGNIEYKLKLLNTDKERIENLASQMRFRCQEGNGECIYVLGVQDNGRLEGITEEEYKETINHINMIAHKNNYSVKILSTTNVDKDKNIYEVLVREINDDKYIDIKIAVAGNVDGGKSTTIGCLTTGIKDNGRGLSRSYVFNFAHELKSGRTSSIAHQILGLDYEGKVVNYQGINKLSWGEIVKKSAKIISFLDLCGHEKYIRTTILGLTSSFPDICMIMIDANNGVKPMTKEHIFLCVTLKIPFIIVVSKIDICKDRQNVLKETMQSINKFLNCPGIRRIPLQIKNNDDIILSSKNIYSESVAPIFKISCVTEEGLDDLKLFFNIVSKKPDMRVENNNEMVEYHIDHIFNVHGFGTVLGGHLIKGTINVGDKLLIGPHSGFYDNVTIRSIYCKKMPLQKATCGSYVCLGIKKADKNNIKRGNVIICNKNDKLMVKKFVAEISILRTHSTTVRVGYEPVLNAYSIRQVSKIVEILEKQNLRKCEDDDGCLRNGDVAKVVLEFKYHCEFLREGTRFILSEGKTKIVGQVLSY